MSAKLTSAQAEQIALEFLGRNGNPDQIKILADKTKEHRFGFVFYCASQKQIDSGNATKDGVPRIGPLIVDRVDRSVHPMTPRADDAEIEDYAWKWNWKNAWGIFLSY